MELAQTGTETSCMNKFRGTDAGRVPLFLWVGKLASTLAMAGLEWDVSWHRSIWRDTAWSPPHLLIVCVGGFCGVAGYVFHGGFHLAGFATSVDQRHCGMRSPLGAWVLGWGCLALVTSVPFDNWWH